MADRRARLLRGRTSILAIGVVAALLFLCGCGGAASGSGAVSGVSGGDDDGYYGAVLAAPYHVADATLTDQTGGPLQVPKALRRPLTLVFFGYSHCPDICQAVMADLASARARLDSSDAARTAVWFVTTDPARDTPAVLRTYVGRFDPAFRGVTGPVRSLLRVAGSVHIPMEKGPRLPGGGYEVTHGTPVLGVRPDGSVPLVWTQGTSAFKLATDVHRYLTHGLPTTNGGTHG